MRIVSFCPPRAFIFISSGATRSFGIATPPRESRPFQSRAVAFRRRDLLANMSRTMLASLSACFRSHIGARAG